MSGRYSSGTDGILAASSGTRSFSAAARAFCSSGSPSPATNALASANASLLKLCTSSTRSGVASFLRSLISLLFLFLPLERLLNLGLVDRLGGGLELIPRARGLVLERLDERVGPVEVRLGDRVLADEVDEHLRDLDLLGVGRDAGDGDAGSLQRLAREVFGHTLVEGLSHLGAEPA